MKILFFLVALVNVALLMWEYNTGTFEEAIDTSDQKTLQNQEDILLVSELKNNLSNVLQAGKHEPDSVEHSLSPESDGIGIDNTVLENPMPGLKLNDSAITATEKLGESDKNTGVNPVICYEAGPFVSDKVYQAWMKQLTAVKDSIKPIIKDAQVLSDYQVYYPAAETLIESEANVQMLKNQGINDIWLLRTGEEQGQISLGVFNKEGRALIMKNQLLAKGINAEVKARYKIKPQKYALVRSNSKVMESLEVLKKAYPEFTVKEQSDSINSCW
ncbi:MAG: hypothetical protein ACXWTT_11370 [Methylobacter sp.]